jgi:hypothetical protein
LTTSARRPSPGSEEEIFRYRLQSPDGDDLGEANYAMMIKPRGDPLQRPLKARPERRAERQRRVSERRRVRIKR